MQASEYAEKFTKEQLLAQAKERGVEGYSGLNKEDLAALLAKADETTEASGETKPPSGETTEASGETKPPSGETTEASGETKSSSAETGTPSGDTETTGGEPSTSPEVVVNDPSASDPGASGSKDDPEAPPSDDASPGPLFSDMDDVDRLVAVLLSILAGRRSTKSRTELEAWIFDDLDGQRLLEEYEAVHGPALP